MNVLLISNSNHAVYLFNTLVEHIVADNTIWFKAKDVCNILRYNHKQIYKQYPSSAFRKFSELICDGQTPDKTIFMNENTVWDLIINCDKPVVSHFKKELVNLLVSVRKEEKTIINRKTPLEGDTSLNQNIKKIDDAFSSLRSKKSLLALEEQKTLESKLSEYVSEIDSSIDDKDLLYIMTSEASMDESEFIIGSIKNINKLKQETISKSLEFKDQLFVVEIFESNHNISERIINSLNPFKLQRKTYCRKISFRHLFILITEFLTNQYFEITPTLLEKIKEDTVKLEPCALKPIVVEEQYITKFLYGKINNG